MQKKLIALAIASAFSAPAFADATLYGAVDAAVASISSSGNKSDLLAVSGGAGSSRIGVNAAEDLDNGMKAVINLEYSLDTQTNTGVGNARQEMLALAGGFGTFATGYLQTAGYNWQVKFDPVAGSLVSPLQSMNQGMLIGTIAAAARAPRALAYISPNMGGFTAAVNYTTELTGGLGALTHANSTQFTKATAMLLSGTYEQGPLAVGLVYASLDGGKDNAGVNQADMADVALGGSYDLGVAKLMATYQTSKTTPIAPAASTTNKAASFSAVIPAGPGVVGVQIANHKNATSNAGATGYLVGYLLPMSKTVTAYAAYESVKNQSATAAFSADNNALGGVVTAGGSSSVLAVGLRKKF
jgi:predicted porin